MRSCGALACMVVTLDCITNYSHQDFFMPEFRWLWVVFAFVWAIKGLQFIFKDDLNT